MSRHDDVVHDNIQFNNNNNNQTLNMFPLKDCDNRQSAYCVNIVSVTLIQTGIQNLDIQKDGGRG